MKVTKKRAWRLILMGLIAAVLIFDAMDRSVSWHLEEEVREEFLFKSSAEDLQNTYRSHFGSREFQFPRETTAKVKLFKNQFLMSRLTSIAVPDSLTARVVNLFNDPDNFDWRETTWNPAADYQYLFRFYDDQNTVIGKAWFCLEDCGMVKSMPFSPNMKFGSFSGQGMKAIVDLLHQLEKI
ncbi:MAG: hypothetical protein AAF466_05035 [Bacteroidota bacterium]